MLFPYSYLLWRRGGPISAGANPCLLLLFYLPHESTIEVYAQYKFFYSPQHALSPPADRPSGGKTISPLNSFPPLLSLILGGGEGEGGNHLWGILRSCGQTLSSRFLTSEGGDHMSSLSCMYVLHCSTCPCPLPRRTEKERGGGGGEPAAASSARPFAVYAGNGGGGGGGAASASVARRRGSLSVRPKATGMKFDVLRCPPNSFPHTGIFF